MKDHVLKIIEQVSEKCFRDITGIDDMRFSFNGWGGSSDAIFMTQQLQQKYLAKHKTLYNMSFLRLDKAFDIP